MDKNNQNNPTFSAAGLLGMILTAPSVSEHQQTPFRVQIAWAAGLGSHQEFAFAASFLGGFGIGQFGFGK